MKNFFICCLMIFLTLWSGVAFATQVELQPHVEEPSIKFAEPDLTEGVLYSKLSTLPSTTPRVDYFFSFYSSTSDKFQAQQVVEYVEQHIGNHVKIAAYHIPIFGENSTELAQAWAIAKALHIQSQVAPLLFSCVDSDQCDDEQGITSVFSSLGIQSDYYEQLKNHFLVKQFMTQQRQAYDDIKLGIAPFFIVNHRYLIHSMAFSVRSDDEYKYQLAQLINYLLTKDHR